MDGGREGGKLRRDARDGGAMRGLSGSSKYLYCIMIRATVKEEEGEGRERVEI